MKIALIIICIVVVVLLVACFFMASFVSKPVTNLEDSKKWEYDHNFWRDFDKRTQTEYQVTSFDGHVIPVVFVKNPKESKDFIVISHGYCSSRYGALKYLNKWMELGFNCIIFDQRYHGACVRKAKECCTLGVKEARDLTAIIEDTYKRYGDDIYLGLQGESMGSATQITALKYKPRVQFVVNDCGFSDIYNVLEKAIGKKFHVPVFFLYPISFINSLFFGWSFIKNRPIDSLQGNTVPICFIHGGDDHFIFPDNSERMKAANPAYSEFHIFDGARHADCMYKDEEKYMEIITNFVKKVKEMETA